MERYIGTDNFHARLVHVCDYLNRLNGYARNAGVQFENGGRDAKDYVEHFLDTCDDRGLEERLCHVRVKDIHDLEDMVNDILRRRERKTSRASSGRRPKNQEDSRRHEVTVANALTDLVAALNVNDATRSRSNRSKTRHHGYDSTETYSDDKRRRDGSRGSSESSDSDSSPDGEYSHVAAANDSERRATAEDADYMFAFSGEVNWPEDREITSVTTMENEKERGVYLSECGVKEWSIGEPSGHKTEGSIASMSRVERSPRSLVPRTKLLPGERLGWWSSQRYDKRKRMRALVKGAVNDVRTRILLDTGANVSVISANYAKRLRLREVPDHGRSLEVRGINPGVLETRRRALVKIALGWERVYEFEMWIMNHSAGVDVVLGTDFVIPAGYKVWQILAYAESRDETLFERERELYECWLAEQPPAVERREYPTPRNILTRDAEDSGPVDESQVYCAEDMTQATDTTGRECAVERIPTEESEHTIPVSESGDRVFEQAQRQSSTHATDDAACAESSTGVTSENIGTSVQILDEPDDQAKHKSRATTLEFMRNKKEKEKHLANDIEITDYAQELAFLPDLTEITVTALDYTGPNVQNKDLDVGQQQKLDNVLKHHEKIMISSGNALPPPAYGVVCDIDVQGHAPIKQRARRTPLRFLGKLYELLKGLLRAGLITFSDSPWASPIVIVLKKNGVDIRLCIDYKMVNAVTAIMEYVMPLVDDLLTDMEAYLWFCSLD
ncbi:Hypothetical protein PHPALM_2012, partial [Phytophthora palmivora]